jgi:hypothetical protein
MKQTLEAKFYAELWFEPQSVGMHGVARVCGRGHGKRNKKVPR